MNPQFRLSTLLLIITAVAVFLSVIATIAPVAVWDGHYKLHIDVQTQSPDQIVEVSYADYFRKNEAEWVAGDSSPASASAFETTTREGKEYVARIRCSGKTNLYGQEIDYAEMRFVVLQITFQDGEIHKVVEVPEGRGPRSVVVRVDEGDKQGSIVLLSYRMPDQ